MAVTVTNQSNPFGSKIVQDTGATNQAVNNTTGTSGTLYMVEIDNTGHSTPVYFKMAAATTATAGTTAPDLVLLCAASSKISYVFPSGIAFANGFCHWCTTAAAQDSVAAPSTPPTVRYIT